MRLQSVADALHAAPRHRLRLGVDTSALTPVVTKAQPLRRERVWRHFEDKGSRGRTVTLKVRFNDCEIIARSRTGRVPISSRSELEHLSVVFFQTRYPLQSRSAFLPSRQGEPRPSCSSAYQFESASIRIKAAVEE
ncbi:hypothetical protein [Bradyrhizobium sp. RDM4]|uniref:DinB/UmuC family translesion DNA polymerase n=1 Tax=Bradyrhizobium sp. RDM4 TaxID=3378765 RepID=UPI0038FC444F